MTTVMLQPISKSQFKAQALEYLRKVEQKKEQIIITHAGKPVAKVVPYKEEAKDPDAILKSLRGTLVRYEDPNKPVGLDDWEALK